MGECADVLQPAPGSVSGAGGAEGLADGVGSEVASVVVPLLKRTI